MNFCLVIPVEDNSTTNDDGDTAGNGRSYATKALSKNKSEDDIKRCRSEVNYSQISWNAKVGMNMSNFTGDMDTDMRIGFNVGVGMEYQFSDMWSIQPSLMFTQKGAKQDEVKMNPMYLEIPVLAAARFAIADNQNIVVKAGPYFAFGIAGKCKIGDEKIDFFGDGDDQFGAKRFDAGLGVGVAYEINKFFIDLSGEFGLAKLADGDGAPKNMNFSIGVGYKF